MENGKHIINKVFLEVNTNSIETAYHLKDNLDVFLKEKVLPYLETYFDIFQKTMPPDGNLQIEKIVMDLSFGASLDYTDLKEAIKRGIVNELEKTRSTNIKNHISSSKKRTDDAFFHFFETGILPWWSDSKTMEIFQDDTAFETLLVSQDFTPKLKHRLLNNSFRERLIKQLADKHLTEICKHCFLSVDGNRLSITTAEAINNLVVIQKKIAAPSLSFLGQRSVLWDFIFCLLLNVDQATLKNKLLLLMKTVAQIFPKKYKAESIETKVVQLVDRKTTVKILEALNEELANSISPDNQQTKRPPQDHEKEAIEYDDQVTPKNGRMEKRDENNYVLQVDEQDSQLEEFESDKTPSDLYIENAGLILLHPYLKQLLLNCELLEGNEMNDPETAAHLLQYIATKKEMQFEHHMVFEKFLCNIPIDRPINRNIELTPDLKMHAEEMLRAVVANWQALGKASVDLLRNEYLQRPGKLILTEDNPKVIVERKTQDILLEKLPWSIGLCKLPWKKKIIFTDW